VRDHDTTVTMTSTVIVGGRPAQSIVRATLAAETWQMISLPSKSVALPAEFADPSKSAYRWSSPQGRYIDEEGSLTSFDRGRGYWINVDQPLQLSVADSNRLLDKKETVDLPMDSGWNMVASPYAYAVRMDTALGAFYGWDALRGDYTQTDVLEPWKAYFYYSWDARPLAFNGTPFNPDTGVKLGRVLTAKSSFKDAEEWQIRVSAQGARSSDNRNFFGFNPMASDGLDRMDAFKPPASPFGGVRVAFESAENGKIALNKSLDRCSRGTHQWLLGVDPGRDAGNITLSYEGVKDLPATLYAYHGDKNNFTDLKAQPSIQLNLAGKEYYTAVVTDDKDFLNKIVRDYELGQNYPNPFNPVTAIRYAIPARFEKNGKPILEQPRVSLKVYDMRGRVVRTIVSGPGEVNKRYAAVWDGKNDQGRATASGMYVYRIDIGGRFVKTMKMVLLK
jgi:hypothetical protein